MASSVAIHFKAAAAVTRLQLCGRIKLENIKFGGREVSFRYLRRLFWITGEELSSNKFEE